MGPGSCSRCGECCRWLPFAVIRQCKPHQLHYLRERGLRESDGYFLIDAPCRHLKQAPPDGSGIVKWSCAIYDNRPSTCRDFCGKALSGGKRFYVPAGCTMAAERIKGSVQDQIDPGG
jgi:Fe-S-cluster containining protein